MTRVPIVLTVVLLTGCASSGSTPSAYVPAQSLAAPLSRIANPDACDRPRHHVIGENGGTFSASCAGWKATINYPPPTAHMTFYFVITNSVTNNFGVPPPPEGTPLYYIQTQNVTRHRTPGFKSTGVTNTIEGPMLSPSHTYSLYVYNFLYDNQCFSGQCPPWVADIGSPLPSTHSITFASPLNGAGFGDLHVIWQFVQD